MIGLNIFICNTPFQYFIVSQLIQNNFVSAGKNIILNTFKFGKSLPLQQSEIYHIRNTPGSLFSYCKINNEIRMQIRNNVSVHFYYPHLNNFFSTVFFRKFETFDNVYHNCYYEGVALFYNPIITHNRMKTISYRMKCFMLFEKYYREKYFFPEELRKVATAFSPKASLTSYFKSIIEFELSNGKNLTKVLQESQSFQKSLLIILPPITDEFEFVEYKRLFMKLLSDEANEFKFFLKPHFEMSSKYMRGFVEMITQQKFEILDNEINIESYGIEFSEVIGLYPSSALINLKLINPHANISTYDFLNSTALNIGEDAACRLRNYFINTGIKLLESCE